MKVTTLTIVVVLSLCALSRAIAQEKAPQDGAWLGSALGIGVLSESIKGQKNNSNTSRFSGKIDVGYDFNPYFGVYSSYDYVQHTWSTHDLHMASVGLKGKEMLTDRLGLFGKAGATYLFDGDHDNGMAGAFGLGFEYQLTPDVEVRLGADYYNDLEISRTHMGNLAQLYYGMTYHFGQPTHPMVETKTVEVIKEVNREVVVSSASSEQLFANNSSTLLSTASLNGLLAMLNENNALNIRIVGYTDSIGSTKYNQQLSERRAESVANFFKEQGIDVRRITTLGRGKNDPIASNATKEGRAQNRRVELTVK